MAVIDFGNLDGAYNMLTHDLSYGVAGAVENGGDFSYGNNLSPLDDIELTGVSLSYVGGANPIAGLMRKIEIAIGNGNETNPDVVIDIGLNVTASLIGDSNDSAENEAVYRFILGGVTTFNFTGSSAGIVAAGDFFDAANGEVIRRGQSDGLTLAGDDTFSGIGANDSFLRGDGDTVTTGARVTGGWDTFSGVFDVVYGDVRQVDAATLFGGNDIYAMTGNWTGDAQTAFFGDAQSVQNGAFVRGGDDTITGVAGTTNIYDIFLDVENVSGASTVEGGDDNVMVAGSGTINVFGDTRDIGGGSEVTGGNDRIDVSAATGAALVYGDFNDITGMSTVTAGNDTLIGGSGNNLLVGDVSQVDTGTGAFVTAGNDLLQGGAGNDSLYGDIRFDATPIGVYGDDTLEGGPGADFLNGNGGEDWASYASSAAAVNVRMDSNTYAGGDAAGDILLNIENILGSDFNDILFGDGGNNRLRGGEGGDLMRGGAGVDTVMGEGGDDNIWIENGDVQTGDIYDAGAGDQDQMLIRVTGGPLDLRQVTISNFEKMRVDNQWSGLLTVSINAQQLLDNFGDVFVEPHFGNSFELDVFLDSLADADLSGITFGGFAAFGDYVRLRGTSADNALTGTNVQDSILGEGGDDTLRGGDENDTLEGGAGNDQLFGGSAGDTLEGGDNDDLLVGGASGDWLIGGDGIDTVSYVDASDRVRIDLLNPFNNTGDAVADTVEGVEAYEGSSFGDTMLGDNGQNVLFGGGGGDLMRGRAARDTLEGQAGDDNLNGGKGRDRLEGGLDDDDLFGSTGKDALFGGRGNDTLDGGDGRDNLNGGRDDDLLDGGANDDVITGGLGNDTFVFADGHGTDTITDFDALNAAEKIDLSAVSAITSIGDITNAGGAGSQQGADVLIDTGGGNSILLLNVSLGDLDAGDFIF